MNAADLEPPWTRTRPSEDPASTSRGTTRGPFVNAMTVDVEDYFQVQAFADRISRDQWDGMTWRVERNTDAVLKLFDDFGIRATFFTLGCVAERFPATIRRIVDQGHELASHGYYHIHGACRAVWLEVRLRRRAPDQRRRRAVHARCITDES